MATVIAAGARPKARATRSKLYVGVALMITAIVLAGFSPSFYGTVVEGVAHPWIIHVHAAVYVGWLLHRVKGGIVAGLTFIIPAFFIMLGLSYVYAVHGDVEWVAALFYGLGAAVVF